ncbi:hypothetical protein [Pseudomaricurvus sp.]
MNIQAISVEKSGKNITGKRKSVAAFAFREFISQENVFKKFYKINGLCVF